MKKLIITAALLLAATAGHAETLVSWVGTGKITFTGSSNIPSYGALGDAVSFTYTFDLDAPDTESIATSGKYSAPRSVSVTTLAGVSTLENTNGKQFLNTLGQHQFDAVVRAAGADLRSFELTGGGGSPLPSRALFEEPAIFMGFTPIRYADLVEQGYIGTQFTTRSIRFSVDSLSSRHRCRCRPLRGCS